MTLEQLSAAATELLPCPFCGEAASFYHIAGSYGYYSSKTGVQCGNGDCLVQPKIAFDDEGYDWGKRTHIPLGSKEKAIADWNTRTGQLVEVQADDATVERVQEAYATFGQTGHLRTTPPSRECILAMIAAMKGPKL